MARMAKNSIMKKKKYVLAWLILAGMLFSCILSPSTFPMRTVKAASYADIVISGSLTLETHVTITETNYGGSEVPPTAEERSSSFTFNFNNFHLNNMDANGENSGTHYPSSTASYSGSWSINSVENEFYSNIFFPDAGTFSGLADMSLSGYTQNGVNGQIVFNFELGYAGNSLDFSETLTNKMLNITQVSGPVPAGGYFSYNPIDDILASFSQMSRGSAGKEGPGVGGGAQPGFTIIVPKPVLGVSNVTSYGFYNDLIPTYSFNGSWSIGGEGTTAIYDGDYSGNLNLNKIIAYPLENATSPTPSPSHPKNGLITALSGDVKILRANGATEPAKLGATMQLQDKILTGANGRVAISSGDNLRIVLGENSEITTEMNSQQEAVSLILLRGTCYVKESIAATSASNGINFGTPQILLSVEGTEFTLQAADDNSTIVSVFSGEVNVQDLASGSNALLVANQTITIHSSQEDLTPQEMSQNITPINLSSTDQWWTQPFSETYNPSILTGIFGYFVLAILIVAVAATTVVAIVLRHRRRPASTSLSSSSP